MFMKQNHFHFLMNVLPEVEKVTLCSSRPWFSMYWKKRSPSLKDCFPLKTAIVHFLKSNKVAVALTIGISLQPSPPRMNRLGHSLGLIQIQLQKQLHIFKSYVFKSYVHELFLVPWNSSVCVNNLSWKGKFCEFCVRNKVGMPVFCWSV